VRKSDFLDDDDRKVPRYQGFGVSISDSAVSGERRSRKSTFGFAPVSSPASGCDTVFYSKSRKMSTIVSRNEWMVHRIATRIIRTRIVLAQDIWFNGHLTYQ
jgi:hypothetical protein